MSAQEESARPTNSRIVNHISLKVSLAYAGVGALWIAFSDLLLEANVTDPRWLSAAQTLKGWLFILITSFLLFLLVRHYGFRIFKLNLDLQTSEAEYRQVIETTPSVLRKSRYPGLETVFISQNVESHLGYRAEQFVQNPCLWHDTLDDRDRVEAISAIKQQLESDGEFTVRYRMRHQDSATVVWFEEQGRLSADPATGERVVSSAMLDVTQHVTIEEKVSYLASHDPLTGLAAQHALVPMLNSMLSLTARRQHSIACLCVGIEQLHKINAAYGRQAGDEVLIQVSDALQEFLQGLEEQNNLREVLLARGDGGRFLVVLPNLNIQHAKLIGTRLLKMLERMTYRVNGEEVHTGIRIGIATHSGALNSADALISRAEAALKETRLLGVESVHILNMQNYQAQTDAVRWLEKIRGGLENDRLHLHFQPLQSLSDHSVHHYEALVRLEDVDGELIPPARIIEVAEQFSIVNRVDQYVLGRVLELMRSLHAARPPIHFAVNLSGVSISDLDFLNHVRQMLLASTVDPGLLIFEITETAAIKDLGTAQHFMSSLRALGCRFALDDFGIGFTSFAHLKTLPVDIIKIDGSFVRNIQDNQTDFGLVRAITQVAKLYGKEVVAEFVENEAVLKLLHSIGVDYAQGYHVGRPVPMRVEQFLGQHGERSSGGV